MASVFPVIGAAVALAGADKLVGQRGYRGMFRHLGWSRRDMRVAGAAEIVGGLLMAPRATRRLGGVIVAATSGAVMVSELRQSDAKLAMPRGLILLASLAAMIAPGPKS